MTHRLVLMLSAILMMFAIFGLVMWIGAIEGENEKAAYGNMMRASMNLRIENLLTEMFQREGSVQATSFAERMGISLDDARDVLDKRSRDRGWLRTEYAQYDARYVQG